MKAKAINSLFIVFFMLGLMPLLPLRFNPIGLVAALILGIVVVIYKKKVSFSFLFFNNIILFLLYIIGHFYSDDKLYSLKYLETSLPLVLFPLFFLFISKLEITKNKWRELEYLFYKSYIVASTIYAIMIFAYVYHLGYFSSQVTYELSIFWLKEYFWGFQNHPIYISLFLGIAILFIIKLVVENKKLRLWGTIAGVIIMLALLFLSRKGILIALLPTSIFLFFITNQNKKIRNVFLSLGVFSLLSLIFVFPNSFNRFKEVATINISKPLDLENATSIRVAIYNCVFSQVQDAGFFGFGIGDVKDKLNDCYKINAKPLIDQNLNTHNVYLNIWLSLGFVGLLVFLYFLLRLLLLAIVNRDFLFLSILIFFLIIFLFENILDRQNGVLLFAFLINFYSYKNTIIKAQNKKQDR